MSLFALMKGRVLDMLFPPQCYGCGRVGLPLCDPCAGALMRIPPQCFVCHAWVSSTESAPPGRTCVRCRAHSAIYCFLSPFSYQHATMRELVHALKYGRNREIAVLFGNMLADHLATMRVSLPENAFLLPIPLHKTRERMRGFNQSSLIAKALAEKLGIKAEKNILRKIKKTAPQMELSREKRLENLKDAFLVRDATAVRGMTILLVDDVKTTGATMEEAARVLKLSGARQIWTITVAH